MSGDRLARLGLLSSYLWGTILALNSRAQLTPDSSLNNENSVVKENATLNEQVVDLIEGGAVRDKSLFHSFSEFNISPNQSVYFAHPKGIDRILTRVTGNNISEIFGTLGVEGTADLFLLNPNGIVFGENASLDLGGSFLATTAESFVFKNNEFYSATDRDLPLLDLKIPLGLQFGSAAGNLEVRGTGHQLDLDTSTLMPIDNLRPSGLEVAPEQTLALIGNQIDLKGGNLTTSGGTIKLAGIAQSGLVELESKGRALELNYENIDTFGNINLSEASSLHAIGDKKGGIRLQGNNITLQDGSAIIADKLDSQNQADIEIIATDSLNMVSDNIASFPSAIVTQTETKSKKSGTNVNIETTNLKLQNALIITTTAGKGRGGDINIVARQADLIANSNSPYPTGVFSQVLAAAKGDGGNIIVEIDELRLLDNGQTIYRIDDEDELEDLIGEDRADDLEDFVEDNEENIVVGLGTLVLQNGGQIESSTVGEGKSGVTLINAGSIQLLDDPELIEPILREPLDTVDEPDEAIAEDVTGTIDEFVENVTDFTISDTDKVNLTVRREETSNDKDSSPKTTFIFEFDDGKNLIVSAEDLTKISEAGSISNTDSNSNEESEAVKIFINGLLTPKSFDSKFDLSSTCRLDNSNFVSVGRGGLPESPLSNIVRDTVLPDLEIFFPQSKFTPAFKPDNSGRSTEPIIEAQNWKINQNGKVELTASSIKSNVNHVYQANCLNQKQHR